MPDNLQSRQLFERCVDQHADSLYRVAFRLTGSRDLAEELVQEAYLSAWRSLSSLQDQSKIRAWMFSILRNQYSKLLRKLPKLKVTSEPVDELAARLPSEEVLDKQECVQAALRELEDDQRLPLLLVAMEGLTVEEAANALQIPKGTVLSRLHRGRQKIKRFLAPPAGSEQAKLDSELDSK